MTRFYFQINDATDDGEQQACSGVDAASGIQLRSLSRSGPAGTGGKSVATNQATSRRAVHWETLSGEPSEVIWPAGTVTVRLNITTANTNIDIDAVHVCQVDSAGTNKASWGSATGLADSASAGIHTHNVTVSEITGALLSDQLYIIINIVRVAGHGGQEFIFSNNQIIDTPFLNKERGILRGVLRGVMRGV